MGRVKIQIRDIDPKPIGDPGTCCCDDKQRSLNDNASIIDNSNDKNDCDYQQKCQFSNKENCCSNSDKRENWYFFDTVAEAYDIISDIPKSHVELNNNIGNSNNDISSNINNCNSVNNIEGADNESKPLCRICYTSEATDKNPLISICHCIGSLKYSHYECLKIWLTTRLNEKTNSFYTLLTLKNLVCEICKQKFPSKFSFLNKPQPCFGIKGHEWSYLTYKNLIVIT